MEDQRAASSHAVQPGRRTWRTILRWIAGLLAAALIAALAGFLIWALWIPAPMPEAIAALQSDAAVTVATTEPLTFTPAAPPTCGFIFYPGARVDPRAYAPALHALAEAGYLAVAPSVRLNLAILSPNRAQAVIDAHPEIARWVVGGHSLGGTMAAWFIYDHPAAMQGLALWASYPADNKPLSARTDLSVTSISASRDGLATPAKVDATRHLLPPQTEFVVIDGGNHAQFGWYGDQRGDNSATIARADQQAQTVAATLRTLEAACKP